MDNQENAPSNSGHPDFATLSAIDEQILAARLGGVRAALAHAGEKGRALEWEVLRILRDLLPSEYGLTTGFIASLGDKRPQLSPQIDIIIYDAIRGAPLARFGTCDVLPIEAVYGYVEVKASLRNAATHESASDSDLRSVMRKNAAIREMRTRWFSTTEYDSPMSFTTFSQEWLAVRAYVIAFEGYGLPGRDPAEFVARMREAWIAVPDAHLHGVLVTGLGHFHSRPTPPGAGRSWAIEYNTTNPLLAFKRDLLAGLATFQRAPLQYTAALHKYYDDFAPWIVHRGADEEDAY